MLTFVTDTMKWSAKQWQSYLVPAIATCTIYSCVYSLAECDQDRFQMVCDVCNMCHGPRFHGHGSPEFKPVRPHGAHKNDRRLMIRLVVATFSKTPLHDDINGAASCQRQRQWTSFDIVAPGCRSPCRLQLRCATHPQHNWLGLRSGAGRQGLRR